MKTSFAFLTVAAAFAAVSTSATPCNMGEIQGKLLANGTAGLENCATTTGYDIWAISDFPTKDQAQKIMKTRDCVDFINQINQRANQEIQCDFQVAGVEKDFGMFLTSLLTGQTGNETIASSSGSGSTIKAEDASGNGHVKPLLDTASSTAGDAFAPTATTAAPSSKSSSTTTSGAAAAPQAVQTGVFVAMASIALLQL